MIQSYSKRFDYIRCKMLFSCWHIFIREWPEIFTKNHLEQKTLLESSPSISHLSPSNQRIQQHGLSGALGTKHKALENASLGLLLLPVGSSLSVYVKCSGWITSVPDVYEIAETVSRIQ